MAHYTGLTGAIWVPTSLGDLNGSGVTFSQIGATTKYVIQTEGTRIARAFDAAAVVGDFSPAAGSVDGINHAIGELDISGAGATVAVTSSNSRVWTLAKLAGFHDFVLNIEGELVDVTEFQDAFRQWQQGVRGWSVVAQRHWQDESFSVNAAATLRDLDDTKFPVEFFIDATAGAVLRYVGMIVARDYALASARSGAVAEATISLTGDGQLWHRTSAD